MDSNDFSSGEEDIEVIDLENESQDEAGYESFLTARSNTSVSSSVTSQIYHTSTSMLTNVFERSRSDAAIAGTSTGARILHGRYDSDDDEDFGDDRFDSLGGNRYYLFQEDHRWSTKLSRFLRFGCRMLLNLVGLPIYWFLVQMFVLEKWLLSKNPTVPIEIEVPRRVSHKRRVTFSNGDGLGTDLTESASVESSYTRTDMSEMAPAPRPSFGWKEYSWLVWIVLAFVLAGVGFAYALWSYEELLKNAVQDAQQWFYQAAAPAAPEQVVESSEKLEL